MTLSKITYTDKTNVGSGANRYYTHLDANEVKEVVNEIADAVDGLAGTPESDPVFAAWLLTNPLADFLTAETDPVFTAWLLATPPVMDESDPVFEAWLLTNPLASFLTEETDPDFNAWLLTSPLANFVETDDARLSDSRTPLSHGNEVHDAAFITADDIPAIPADISELTDTTGLLFSGDYDDLDNKPTIPADVSELTDTTGLLFSGDYDDLDNKPAIPPDYGDHAGLYDPVGSATGAVEAHELAYDHSTFLTEESDPVFGISEAASITSTDTGNWNDAYGWGDHAGLYDPLGSGTGAVEAHELAYDHDTFLTAETDPEFSASEAANFEAGDKNILDGIRQSQVDAQDPTGFLDPANITMTFDSTARTITLTHTSGFVDYYWQGEKKQLASGWESDPYIDIEDPDDGVAKYLLSTDGTNFVWSDTSWTFNIIQVAYIPADRSFAMRECHGIMPYSVHDVWHRLIGTFRKTGGGLVAGTFALNTDTDDANTPSFAACTIADEDLDSVNALWTQGTYTHLWFTGTGTVNFNTTRTTIPYAEGAMAFVNTISGGTFAWAPAAHNRFLNYYVIRMPVTADADSQKYRCIVLQPQVAYTSLTAAQAEETRSLNLGDFASLAPEFIEVERMTFRTANANSSTGKVQMVANAILTGSKISQVAVSGVTPTTAENVSFTPAGTIAAVNVQAALEELDSEKQAAGSYLTEETDPTAMAAIGDEAYTEENYIDEENTIRENLDALDVALSDAVDSIPSLLVSFGTEITDATADITAANHKLKTTDINKATAVTLTLKKNGFAKGEWFVLHQLGDGQFTLNGEAGVTVPAWKKSAGKGFDMYVLCTDATTDANVFRITGGVE